MRRLIDQAGWIFRSHLATVQPLDDQQRLVTRMAVGFLILPAVFVNQSLANGLFCAVALLLGFRLPKAKWPFFGLFLAIFLVGLVVIYQFEELTTSSVFAAFLSQIIAMKTWELRSSRDTHFAVYGSLFAVFTGTLVGNIELFGVLVIPQVVVAVGALFYAESRRLYFGGLSLRFLVRYLPLMSLVVLAIVTLFALFPRIGGGFLDFGFGSTQQVGLSDRVRPGELASLADNDDVVFRVWGDVPRDGYWRAFVMDQYQDGEWFASENRVIVPELLSAPLNRLLRMEMESNQLSRIPRLQWSQLSVGQTDYGLTQRLDSDESMYLDIELQLYSTAEESYHPSHLAIPSLQPAPQLEQWLGPIRDESLEDQIASIGNYFRDTKTYSVTPSVGDVRDIDQLWFDINEGYCGYFAGMAAEALMRLGYPVRMVTGFLGHDQPEGLGYVLVRQEHAHAWIDVHDGEQWRTLDPTTWVVAESGAGFSQSLVQSFLEQRSQVAGLSRHAPDWLPIPVRNALIAWARMSERTTRFLIDNVLYFDRDKQLALYAWLQRSVGWVLAFIVALAALVAMRYLPQSRGQTDKRLRQYDAMIAKAGITRLPGMLPGDEDSDVCLSERLAFREAWLSHSIRDTLDQSLLMTLDNALSRLKTSVSSLR